MYRGERRAATISIVGAKLADLEDSGSCRLRNFRFRHVRSTTLLAPALYLDSGVLIEDAGTSPTCMIARPPARVSARTWHLAM